jgi:hypothetical protein
MTGPRGQMAELLPNTARLPGAQMPESRGSAELGQPVLLTVNSPVMPFWACPGTGHR